MKPKEILVIDWWLGMINKLERRFTIVAISVVSAVLLILLIGVNVYSISDNIRRVDTTLDSMAETKFNDVGVKRIHDGLPFPTDKNVPPLEKEKNRIFELIIDDNNSLIKVYGQSHGEDDYDTLIDKIMDNDQIRGFSDDYRYLKVDEGSSMRLIILDYSFERRAESSFMWGSVIIFVLSILLIAVLVKIFLKPVMGPIKDAYKKQKQFITDASHELRTPLTIISTDIQLLELDHGESDWSKSVQNQVKRLEELTEGLVMLSRLEEDEHRIEKHKVNLSNIVNDVVMGFEPAILAAEKSLKCHIEEDVYVMGNYDGLEKVLSTIMHNALKYSSDYGDISVNLIQEKYIELKITNSTDQLEKGSHSELFERFYRAESSRNSRTGGFGIGLAIAKSVVEDHKGKMDAFSQDGQSLTIKIEMKKYKPVNDD